MDSLETSHILFPSNISECFTSTHTDPHRTHFLFLSRIIWRWTSDSCNSYFPCIQVLEYLCTLFSHDKQVPASTQYYITKVIEHFDVIPSYQMSMDNNNNVDEVRYDNVCNRRKWTILRTILNNKKYTPPRPHRNHYTEYFESQFRLKQHVTF